MVKLSHVLLGSISLFGLSVGRSITSCFNGVSSYSEVVLALSNVASIYDDDGNQFFGVANFWRHPPPPHLSSFTPEYPLSEAVKGVMIMR